MPAYQEREKAACNAFESAFGITRPWDWYPAKGTEANVWREFRADVMKLYEADHNCFTAYVTWMRQPFVKGAKSAIYIKENPQNFMTIWAGFLASNSMYADQAPKYKPIPEDNNHYVPNPNRRPSK